LNKSPQGPWAEMEAFLAQHGIVSKPLETFAGVTRNGQTERAYGHLILEQELSEVVLSENRGGLASDAVAAGLGAFTT